MMTRDDRQPIVVADAGPLIRLAATGLLDTMRGWNRRILLVDRVEDEVASDLSKPFTADIAASIVRMGDAILRVETVTGVGVDALRARQRAPSQDALLKTALRVSGEQAVREFVGHWRPTESATAVVLCEDRKVATLFLDVEFPITLMTTRAFAPVIAQRGVNADAVTALEAIADRYDLNPALIGEIDPSTPVDLRRLPEVKPS